MAQHLRALAALPEALSSVSSTLVGWLLIACGFSPTGSAGLCGRYVHNPQHTHKEKKKNKSLKRSSPTI